MVLQNQTGTCPHIAEEAIRAANTNNRQTTNPIRLPNTFIISTATLIPMKRPHSFLPLLFIFGIGCFTNAVHAQITGPEQDCISALPVCQMVYTQNDFYLGAGEYPEINDTVSCLANGENNSVWYIFTVSTPGMLEFLIIPD